MLYIVTFSQTVSWGLFVDLWFHRPEELPVLYSPNWSHVEDTGVRIWPTTPSTLSMQRLYGGSN